LDYCLIALDLDDTLLGEDQSISERNRLALKKARQKGVHVTIATGRMFRSCLPYARELGLSDIPVIVYHGALIRTLQQEEPLYYRPLEKDLALEVINDCQEKGYHVNLYLEDRICVKEHNVYTRYYKTISSVEMEPVGELTGYLKQCRQKPAKLTVINWDGWLDDLQQYLQQKYGSRLKVMGSLPNFLEITHPEATKGQALEFLSSKLGISREQVIAFGDSYNDIDMLEYAGLGVAVGNARPEVKEVADLVTLSHGEDGVAEVIEKYVVNRL